MRVHELLKVSHVDQAELFSDGKFRTGVEVADWLCCHCIVVPLDARAGLALP